MSLSFFSISDKKYWWPVILPLAFCLVFLGMRPPVLPKPHKPNVHFRAVVETPGKDAKARSVLQKCCVCAELPGGVEIPAPPVFGTRSPFSKERSATPATLPAPASRAPPPRNA